MGRYCTCWQLGASPHTVDQFACTSFSTGLNKYVRTCVFSRHVRSKVGTWVPILTILNMVQSFSPLRFRNWPGTFTSSKLQEPSGFSITRKSPLSCCSPPYTNGRVHTWTHRLKTDTYRHTHTHTHRQTDRLTDRQTDTHLVDKISLHNPNPVALKGITAEGHDSHSTVVHGEHSCRAGKGDQLVRRCWQHVWSAHIMRLVKELSSQFKWTEVAL